MNHELGGTHIPSLKNTSYNSMWLYTLSVNSIEYSVYFIQYIKTYKQVEQSSINNFKEKKVNKIVLRNQGLSQKQSQPSDKML